MFYRIAALLYVSASLVSAQTVFVSELHYENSDVESGQSALDTGNDPDSQYYTSYHAVMAQKPYPPGHLVCYCSASQSNLDGERVR